MNKNFLFLLILKINVFFFLSGIDEPLLPENKFNKKQFTFLNDSCPLHNKSDTIKCGPKQIIAYSPDMLNIAFINYNVSTCRLHSLFVNKEYRKQGIGIKLFNKAIKDMKLHGCKKVLWHATESSRNFYKKMGACDYNIPEEYWYNMYYDIKETE